MKKLSMILIVFLIFGLSATGYTSEECLLFDGTFERSTKTPGTNKISTKTSETQIGHFNAVDGGAIVEVYNGAQEDGAQKVSSATISINGKQVIGPSDFNQNVDYIKKIVDVKGEDNSLKVLLKSKPGGKIKVVIVQPNVFALSASDGNRAAGVCAGDRTYPDKVIGEISVTDGQLKDLAVSPDGAYVYVTDANDNTVKVIQPSINSVKKTIQLDYPPFGVTMPDGQQVYVSHTFDNKVSVIQTSDNMVTTIDDVAWPYDLAVAPYGQQVYVSNSFVNKVSIIQTSDNKVEPINVDWPPASIAVAPNGQYVYVNSLLDSTVYVIQTSDNTVTPMISVGTKHHDIGVTPDGAYVYVSNPTNQTVSAINTSDHTATTIYGVGSYPYGIAVTPSGKYVYVSSLADDKVSVIQTSDNTVIKTIEEVGDGPDGIAVSPDGAYVYVICTYGQKVSVIGY